MMAASHQRAGGGGPRRCRGAEVVNGAGRKRGMDGKKASFLQFVFGLVCFLFSSQCFGVHTLCASTVELKNRIQSQIRVWNHIVL